MSIEQTTTAPTPTSIDRRHIGHRFPAFRSLIEAGRIRLFCKAIGETSAVHLDVEAARAAGYRHILAPITFPTAIAMDNPNPRCVIELLNIDIGWVLHGEEHYEYLKPICVGDEVTAELQIADIYAKKGGALEFVVCSLQMRNQFAEEVCRVRRSLVIRRPQTAGPAGAAP
jgi:acyl dehydratase